MKEQRVVFKYRLDQQGILPLPDGAKVLKFAFQAQLPYIWAEVPKPIQVQVEENIHSFPPKAEHEKMVPLYYSIVGTGFEAPDHLEHFETVLQGPLVWHLYLDKTHLRN